MGGARRRKNRRFVGANLLARATSLFLRAAVDTYSLTPGDWKNVTKGQRMRRACWKSLRCVITGWILITRRERALPTGLSPHLSFFPLLPTLPVMPLRPVAFEPRYSLATAGAAWLPSFSYCCRCTLIVFFLGPADFLERSWPAVPFAVGEWEGVVQSILYLIIWFVESKWR